MLFTTRSPRRPAMLLVSAAVGLGCLTSGLALVAPATAAPLGTTVTPTTVTPVALGTDTPTDEQVEQARRAAAESAARAAAAQAEVERQQAELDALAGQASAALETYQQAMENKQQAETEEATQRERLAQAEIVLEAGKKDLGQ